MKQFTFTSRKQQRARGLTIPMLALFIVVLFAMASLAVDLGILYSSRTSAQHAADAAALAGANTFADPTNDANQPTIAYNTAILIAGRNKIFGQAVTITATGLAPCSSDMTTSWVCVDVAQKRVTVNVARTTANSSPITLYFARVINHASADVATQATAEAAPSGGGSMCVKPVFIPNTAFAPCDPSIPNNTDPLKCTRETIQQACNPASGPKHTLYIQDGSGNWVPNPWAQGDGTLASPPTPSSVGMRGTQLAIFRPVTPSASPAPSQYFSIDVGSGGNTYGCAIANCLKDCRGADPDLVNKFTSNICSVKVWTQNGTDIGETIGSTSPKPNGFLGLIGSSPDSWAGTTSSPFDPLAGFWVGGNANGTLLHDSRSLFVAPVWDDCPSTTLRAGRMQVDVIGTATIFINPTMSGSGPNAGNISGYLWNLPGCGNPNVSGSGTNGIPVRLIQPGN